MGVVLGDVFLFSGDILSNLKLGNPDVPEDRIRAALRNANAEGLVRRMPGGLRVPVRERGNNLSAGQRQFLALVRMFVVDPEIIPGRVDTLRFRSIWLCGDGYPCSEKAPRDPATPAGSDCPSAASCSRSTPVSRSFC